jgi:rod shape-determining protein MreC
LGKSSIGLGLATREMSISTCQDRKIGKTASVFLLVSLSLLLTNIVSTDFSNKAKHFVSDYTLGISDVLSTPVNALSDKIAHVKAIWDMQETHDMLAQENERLMQWYQTANRLDAENKALRDLLKMKDDNAVSYKAGQVIGDTETQYSHTILVRLGENDGLEKGRGVLSHEGLIGRVIETGKETSRVLLLSDINSRIPVTIDGLGDRAILAGTNNGDPILDHLPETNGVTAGQKIITSGHGGIFPYGVPVGETYLTDNNQIAVRPYAKPDRASYVQIVDYGVPAGSTSRSVASSSSHTTLR